jgi:hypothetical protein
VSTKTLEDLAAISTDDLFGLSVPADVRFRLEAHPSPGALKNLAKLKRLGLCSPDAVMSLLAVAPVDPVNLMAKLMRVDPTGWVLDPAHFMMVRVLAQDDGKHPIATLNVDLLGSCVVANALNEANQLTVFRVVDATDDRETLLQEIQALVEDAVYAAKREAANHLIAKTKKVR